MPERPSKLRHPQVTLRRARLMPPLVLRTDDRAARWINGASDSARIDTGFRELSHAADRGLLWFAIAGLLALAGRRRAALRGVVSLTAASMLANLIGKRVFGGDRQLLDNIPVGRRLRTHPTSPSFPSGHSASAAAFATGVAVESPVAGALLAPLAAGVAYSRLHTGAHWLSDVVGGVGLGAGVALLGALRTHLVPTHPIGGAGRPVDLPASRDGEGVLILANERAGQHVARRDPLRTVHRRLPRATVRVLRKGQQPEEIVAAAMQGTRPPVVLGVLGGDGTVSAVAGLARRHRLPLLVLPGGTFNHFARAVGVTVDEAIDALQAGAGLSVDVAELVFDDRDEPITVLNAASVGLYPDFVAVRAEHEERWTKWIASLIAAVRISQRLQPTTVVIGGRRARAWSVFVSVDRNDPRLISTLQRRRLDDRLLDVRILHAGGTPLRAVTSLIFGRRTAAVLRALRLMPNPTRIESFTTQVLTMTVRARDGVLPRVGHDGELDRPVPARTESFVLRARVVPDGLRVYSRGPERAE